MSDIVMFGAKDAAEVAAAYVDAHSEHRIVAFTADAAYCDSREFRGRPLVPWERLEQFYPPDQVGLLGPISYRRMNQLRRDRYLEGKQRGYRFVSFVHPSVELLSVEIGEHAFICPDTLIEPGARLGNNVMVWSRAHIGHHAVIGDHCFIGPGAGIGGMSTIGECCFFGPHSSVMPGLTVGRACFLGHRAGVAEDAPDGAVYRGAESSPRARCSSDRLARRV